MQIALVLTPEELKLLKELLYNETQTGRGISSITARRVYEKLERAEHA